MLKELRLNRGQTPTMEQLDTLASLSATGLSPLADHPGIGTLWVERTNIREPSPLLEVPIQYLYIEHNPITEDSLKEVRSSIAQKICAVVREHQEYLRQFFAACFR